MFDLDIIENDWKQNGRYLTDEEILEIYRNEGVTTKDYEKEIEEYKKSLPKPDISAEEKILNHIFSKYGEESKKYGERWAKIADKSDEIKKEKHLSPESQKRVVEGCMDLVFEYTRAYHEFFKKDKVAIAELIYYNIKEKKLDSVSMEEIMEKLAYLPKKKKQFPKEKIYNIPVEEFYNVSMEELYYVFLRALMNSAKYCLHYYTKPCFRAYASASMDRAIIRFMERKEHISYQNASYIMNIMRYGWDYMQEMMEYEYDFFKKPKPDYATEFKYIRNNMEIVRKGFIHNILRGFGYDVDYIGIITDTSKEFIVDYLEALDELSPIEENVMRLLYDDEGYRNLTLSEIAEKLSIPVKYVKNAKCMALCKLRKNKNVSKYRD